jgi:hypothetical protein
MAKKNVDHTNVILAAIMISPFQKPWVLCRPSGAGVVTKRQRQGRLGLAPHLSPLEAFGVYPYRFE